MGTQPSKETAKSPISNHNSFHNIISPFPAKRINKVSVIGCGAFGKVFKVQLTKSRKTYAMKQMSKTKILLKRSVESVLSQLNILKSLKHPFLINVAVAFQDRQCLYLVMDLLSGGDLRYHLMKQQKFDQKKTQFFIACLLISLEFLHNNCVLHRDVKPENLVFDEKGYLRLTDFGVARIWKPQNFMDTSGTPGYMSPQVLCRVEHGITADYFAVGVIVYQCMFGVRPFVGKSRNQIRDEIMRKQIKIKKKEIPFGWSTHAVDFIHQTLRRNPKTRLGKNGPREIMEHPWFQNMDWQKLRNKSLVAPFNPVYYPQEYLQKMNELEEPEISADLKLMLKKEAIQSIFSEYFYDGGLVQTPLIENPIQ